MPAYYLSKPKCCECQRDFPGINIGHGQDNQPFVFRLQPDMTEDSFLSKYIALLANDELELRNQWSQIQDKEEFLAKMEKYKNMPFTTCYYEQETIKQNSLGYLYSSIALHLR